MKKYKITFKTVLSIEKNDGPITKHVFADFLRI